MAAYAALVSVMHIIDQIQHHPRPPISLDQKQAETLTRNVAFLQEFLEGYSHVCSKEPDGLETRIADAAYAAEDVVESYIVDQILTRSTNHVERISLDDFYQDLQKVIEDMDLIKKDAVEIKEKMEMQDQLHTNSSISASSVRFASTRQNGVMVGLDDVLYEMMDKLTGGQLDRRIIPIVGMGGIGKTTLARNCYENQVVEQHFDIRAWVTISQEYKMKEILLKLLQEDGVNLIQTNESEIGNNLHKKLLGRRYLIVIDDIWNVEAWDQLKSFFPNNSNGSRIMLTTRLSDLAFQISGSHGFHMDFLNEDESWTLLCKHVFGKEVCPLEMEEIGKKIARNCRGLPLSIVVIGGLLTKYNRTREYWEHTLENLNSAINLEGDERCLQILYTSYKELPIHLKPCFLYMGIFPEDTEIRVSELTKLWVAEGFLKPIVGKSLEVVAEEYLMELIDRNLILVHKLGSNGKTKFCKIHDLLRVLCLREARKQKFLFVTRPCNLNSPQGINIERRITIHERTSMEKYDPPQVLHALQSASLARSLIVNCKRDSFERALQSANPGLLRVFKADERAFSTETLDGFCRNNMLCNLRYVSSGIADSPARLPHNFYWNLQTVLTRCRPAYAFSAIWKMPLLRHVDLNIISLPDPPSGHMEGRDDLVLGNLQTLSKIRISDLREKVVERIPNVKKLRISYGDEERESLHCFKNLGHLRKLERLHWYCYGEPVRSELLQNLTFPHSLKKLTLHGCRLHWEDITTKIGPLPLLEVLKLRPHSLVGPEWVTVEGQFRSLKFLLIGTGDDLVYWNTDRTHFPCLEHLSLIYLTKLEEIPWGIGEIPTLQSIGLFGCGYSAVVSAKRILEEQRELGNDGLQVRVVVFDYDKAPQNLASEKFPVEIMAIQSIFSWSPELGSKLWVFALFGFQLVAEIVAELVAEIAVAIVTAVASTAEIEEIPEKVTDENAAARKQRSSWKLDKETKAESSFDKLDKTSNRGGESTMDRIPPLRPPTFWKIQAWKFEGRGDYIGTKSNNSPRSGSSEPDEADSDVTSSATDDRTRRRFVSLPLFYRGSDVNTKAGSFLFISFSSSS